MNFWYIMQESLTYFNYDYCFYGPIVKQIRKADNHESNNHSHSDSTKCKPLLALCFTRNSIYTNT